MSAVPPLLKVSKDSMEVLATIYPKDFRGNPITIERIALRPSG